MADSPHGDDLGPVKQRRYPVPCKQCGRTNWSIECLCVYCRLGWPDPEDTRGITPDNRNIGNTSLAQPTDNAMLTSEEALSEIGIEYVTRAVKTDEAGRISEDIVCVGCSYNLRGLKAEGNCPECGQTIHHTLRQHRLAYATARWLSTMERGCWLIFAGMVLTVLSMTFPYIVPMMLLPMISLLIASLSITFGVCLISTPISSDPRVLDQVDAPRAFGKLAQSTSAAFPLSVIILGLVLLSISGSRLTQGFLEVAIVVCAALMATCVWATTRLLAHYAKQLHSKPLHCQAVIFSYVWPILTGLVVISIFVALSTNLATPMSLAAFCGSWLMLLVAGMWAIGLIAIFAAAFTKAKKAQVHVVPE